MSTAVLLTALALAAGPEPAAEGWRSIATADANAALELIADNHPGAAPELGDADFQARLSAARAMAADRLPEVRDYGSYSGLMLGLANLFGDGHIRTSGKLSVASVGWPGLIATRRGGKWLVGYQEEGTYDADFAGAEILSCDAVAAEKFGRERVGAFYADPASEAAMASKAYTLLLDSGNAWAPPPKTCDLRSANGTTRHLALAWRQTAPSDLQPKLLQAIRPARAGMGISSFEGGQWIALETLDDGAELVVAEVEKNAADLRQAPLVVFDLRGNGGGNSDYARRIAVALVGQARVDAVAPHASACSGAYWRASEGNLAAVKALAGARSGESKAYFEKVAADLASARTEGQSFSPALPACAARQRDLPPSPKRLPPMAMKGRLVLLTDRACFSSCLIATDLFRRIGALHVGEETDRSTRYMEVRDVILPSGLRTFSTLMKAAVGLPDYGPFTPTISYGGPMDDSEAVKTWVTSLPEVRR